MVDTCLASIQEFRRGILLIYFDIVLLNEHIINDKHLFAN